MEQNAGFCLFRAAETCRDGFDACNLGRSGARSAHRGFHGKKCAGAAQENRRSLEAAVGRKESRGFEIVSMTLPLKKQYAPMEALPATELPEGPEWQYEPKWDGFRCLAFRAGDGVELQSKSGQPLARYFPELVAGLKSLRAPRFVLDGEIVIPVGKSLSFDDLLQRIHPAESRVRKLAAETPALYLVFDLLVDEKGKLLAGLPLSERRRRLEGFAAKFFGGPGWMLPAAWTADLARAEQLLRLPA